MTDYAHPEVLVTTDWLAGHLNDPAVRVIEVDYEPAGAYETGHIPGAALVDWKRDVNDTLRRDILSHADFEQLMGRLGVTPGTALVLYGDMRNWFAAFALWTFKIYGHADVRLLNGGRSKWIAEERALTTDVPLLAASTYAAPQADRSLRALRADVERVLDDADYRLVDVRSVPEFRGEITAPAEYANEGAQRAGHIPGAVNIPWAQAIRDDDTFKSADELSELYTAHGVTVDRSVVTYCRIGERSSHTWFVLKYLLGFPDVVNYDGSWSEWGNAVGVPVERTELVTAAP